LTRPLAMFFGCKFRSRLHFPRCPNFRANAQGAVWFPNRAFADDEYSASFAAYRRERDGPAQATSGELKPMMASIPPSLLGIETAHSGIRRRGDRASIAPLPPPTARRPWSYSSRVEGRRTRSTTTQRRPQPRPPMSRNGRGREGAARPQTAPAAFSWAQQ
jgi:hypothetical protein